MFTKFMPFIYGIGASVVIVGALFKIRHLPGADLMLTIGLLTEAVIFALSAFQPPAHEYAWERAYPELLDESADNQPKKSKVKENGLTARVDDMLANAKVGPELINSLGMGLRSLTDTTSKLSNLTDVTVATSEYAKNVNAASKSLVDLNHSYAATIQATGELANATKDAKAYHEQVQTVTKNLGALNAVYELEYQDANKHLKTMNAFYSNLSSAMQNMNDASKDAEQFKGEMSKLTTNLTSLNKVYGSMLSAMKG